MVIRIKHAKGSELVTLPNNWGQVTWSQMLALKKGVDYCEVFTGIPITDWKSKGATRVYMRLNSLLSWVHTLPDYDSKDFKMEVGGIERNFKSVKLQLESVGQYLDCGIKMEQYIKKNGKGADMVKLYPVIIAIYADGLINGDYDHGRAMGLVDGIKGQPFGKVNNIGGFFLNSLTGLTGGRNLLWLLLTYLKRKFWQASPLLTINIKVPQH